MVFRSAEKLEASELEMSALNWSVSNSKCTALNSTNHENEGNPGLEACLTPNLTGLSRDKAIHTPDPIDSLLGDEAKDAGNPSPARQQEPAIHTPDLIDCLLDEARGGGGRSNASTPQLCGIKHLVVATIETPRPTPDEKEESATKEQNQDFVATQRFPGANLIESDEEEEPTQYDNAIGGQNQDFVATQRFPGTSLSNSDEEDQLNQENKADKGQNQDFVATQRFPGTNLGESDEEDQPNQDLVPTQLFVSAPGGRKKPKSPENSNKNMSLNQDFIATQVFPTRSRAVQNKENMASVDNSSEDYSSKGRNTQFL